MTVKAILTSKGREVATIDPATSLESAAKALAERRIGALVVVGSDKRMAGLISERDIVAAIAKGGAKAMSDRVEQVMTKKIVTCSEGETVAEIMERMTTGKFRHLPVIEDGQLSGIVSIGDVVKYRLGEMERESEQMRDYILTA